MRNAAEMIRNIALFVMTRLILIGAFLWSTLTSCAEVEVVDGRTWTYYDWGGEIEVSGVSPSTGEVVIPSTLSGRPVKSIGADAFFRSALTSVKIPEGVMTIRMNSFRACANLKSVEIPSSVTDIDGWAFYNNSLTSIVVKVGNRRFDSRNDCNAIIETATGVLICGCQATVVPAGVLSIGDSAFGYCTALTRIKIPAGVANIGDSAFQGCQSLTDVSISSSVTNIGSFAFNGCNELKRMAIPSGVKSIGTSVFTRCCSVANIVVDQSNTKYDSRNNCNAIINTETGELVQGCRATIVPFGVKSIGSAAFMGCSELTSLQIPSEVTKVGSSAFDECSALKSIAIPTGVTSIDDCCFRACSSLISVMIPSTVANIGVYAFQRCDSLAVVYVDKGDGARVKGLYPWPTKVEFVEVVPPTVNGDVDAVVTGDPESGFLIRPSANNMSVEVTIPQGVDASKVTVVVSPKVMSVKSHAAKVKVFRGYNDITEFLDVPMMDEKGVIDLLNAKVKDEIVKEAMDVKKGAVINLNAANPVMITPNTRAGLIYRLREGRSLDGMSDGDSVVGDGKPWSPEITVKGCESGFYSIGVVKDE